MVIYKHGNPSLLLVFNFRYKWTKDLILFSIDQKSESYNENDKNIVYRKIIETEDFRGATAS